MKYSAVFLVFIVSASTTWAENLSCAVNELTNAYMCFHKDKVKANGDVRATTLYTGGPKGVDDTGFTARVHCVSKAIELTDRKGVAFARNYPKEQVGKDFVRYLCEHKPVKNDPKLSTK